MSLLDKVRSFFNTGSDEEQLSKKKWLAVGVLGAASLATLAAVAAVPFEAVGLITLTPIAVGVSSFVVAEKVFQSLTKRSNGGRQVTKQKEETTKRNIPSKVLSMGTGRLGMAIAEALREIEEPRAQSLEEARKYYKGIGNKAHEHADKPLERNVNRGFGSNRHNTYE